MNRKQRIGIALGNAFEYYDIAVLAAISGYLSLFFEKHGINHANETVWGIFALRFLIRPLGGFIIGYYANSAGRKSALMLTSLLTGGATVILALMPEGLSGTAILMLFLGVQLVQAFAFGGEYPALINILLSDARKDHLTRISSLLVGSSLAGVILSSVVVLCLKSATSEEWMASTGWRIPVLLGVVNLAISFWFRCRLPVTPMPEKQICSRTQSLRTAFNIFLCTIPGAVVFYILNFAGGITGKALHLGYFTSIWPALTSGILLVAIIISGQLVDRYSTPMTVFRLSLNVLFLAGIPLYVMLGSAHILWVAIAQALIIMISGVILACLAAVLWELSEGRNLALGVGYNISLSIFGGLTPLFMVYLTPYGIAAAGTYIIMSSLPAAILLHRYK